MRRLPFDEIWSTHGHRAGVSREIEPLVRAVYRALCAEPLDLTLLRRSLERLLTFLTSPGGRTNANCTAIDSFFCLGEFEWPDLPDAIADILSDMGGALHDTVTAPEIAENFESTPEQLLYRLRAAP